jgi:hypothetical protein
MAGSRWNAGGLSPNGISILHEATLIEKPLKFIVVRCSKEMTGACQR